MSGIEQWFSPRGIRQKEWDGEEKFTVRQRKLASDAFSLNNNYTFPHALTVLKLKLVKASC